MADGWRGERAWLLYGDRDRHTPPAHGERLVKALASAADATLHVFAGVDHTFAYRDAREAYASLVVPFLTYAIRAAAHGRPRAR